MAGNSENFHNSIGPQGNEECDEEPEPHVPAVPQRVLGGCGHGTRSEGVPVQGILGSVDHGDTWRSALGYCAREYRSLLCPGHIRRWRHVLGNIPVGPDPCTISVFSITSTGGSIFNGFSYESTNGGADRNVTPPSCGMIQFSFAVPNQSQIVIAVPGDSAATFNGGAITRTCPGASIISFEQLFPPTAVFRTVRSGLVSPLPSISVISTGCTSCSPGSVVTFHAHIVNPGPAIVVELKTGVRLPDGTIISLLGRHHEQALGAGQTVDIDLISGFVVPLGAPSGTYPVEAALLEPDLGVTLSRHSLPVQILP